MIYFSVFLKQYLIRVCIVVLGFVIAFGSLFIYRQSTSTQQLDTTQATETIIPQKPQIIGFLPYWLLSKADKDYTQLLTTVTYFGLTISGDGTIQKYTSPGESEPGWLSLQNGKVDTFLEQAKTQGIQRSLLVFSGDPQDIDQLISNPILHARNLMNEVAPVMKAHDFTDLNIDVESVSNASESARLNFTLFIKEIRKEMDSRTLGTLTIDASPTDLIKNRLIDLAAIKEYVDTVVLMTYDYHYVGSVVTGPVAPVGGAGTEAEFDVETGVQKALEVLPKEKIIVGVPLYGYEWETLGQYPRSATIPTTGLVVSNRRAEEFLETCKQCKQSLDRNGKESYIVYQDDTTKTFHHMFYPDKQATKAKINLVKKYHVSGLALWALGYEGDTILDPLLEFKRSSY